MNNEELKIAGKKFCEAQSLTPIINRKGDDIHIVQVSYLPDLLSTFAQSLIDSGRFVEADSIRDTMIHQGYTDSSIERILSIVRVKSENQPNTNVPVISDEEMLRSAHEYTYSISGMDQFTISEQLVHAHYAGAKWYSDQLKAKS